MRYKSQNKKLQDQKINPKRVMPKIYKKIISLIIVLLIGIFTGIIANHIYDILKNSKPNIEINSINDISIVSHNTKKDIPILINKKDNFIHGKYTINDFFSNEILDNYRIYPILLNMNKNKYIVQPQAADDLFFMNQAKLTRAINWEGKFSIDDNDINNNENRFVLYVVLSKQPLSPGPIESDISKYEAKSKGIRLKFVSKLPQLPQGTAHIIHTEQQKNVSLQKKIQIYLGETTHKKYKIDSKTITANLFYMGFSWSVVSAQINWGEGNGWETIGTHRQGELYHIQHTYKNIGYKVVRYRVFNDKNDPVEDFDEIEIVENIEK